MATMVSVTVVLVVAPSGDTKWWQRDGGVSGCDNIGGYCSIDDGDGNGDNDDGGDGDGGNNGGGSNVGGDALNINICGKLKSRIFKDGQKDKPVFVNSYNYDGLSQHVVVSIHIRFLRRLFNNHRRMQSLKLQYCHRVSFNNVS